MRVTKVELVNFKRFFHLVIDNIPVSSKLVLLTGANGSGKSCVLDAFQLLSKGGQPPADFFYYAKGEGAPEAMVAFSDGSRSWLSNNAFQATSAGLWDRFIGRSSLRITPRITSEGMNVPVSPGADAPASFIDPDTRFHNDLALFIQQIDNALREPIFSGRSADTLQIFQDFIQPFNQSLLNIFGGNVNTTIQLFAYQNTNAQSTARLIFQKGASRFNYDLLSQGEKQVVTLLLNFIVRKEYYQDALICIDDMDSYLNPLLQGRLLAEVVNVWIPDNAQLWAASHSLGFIAFAKNHAEASIVNLDALDFDVPQVITAQS